MISRCRTISMLFAALFLAGCGGYRPPLRVGIVGWLGCQPLHLAQELGYFTGQDIEIVTLNSTTEIVRAYRNQAIDVVAVTADEALALAAETPDQHAILVCDYSRGADRILARPPLASMPELRGKRIGVEANATGAYVLSRGLQLVGMTARDVTVVPMSIDEHEGAYTSGQVDAVVTYEPCCGRLQTLGACSVFDSSQIPGEIIDLLVTNTHATVAHKAALASLVTGWFRALAYLRQNPENAARLMAPRMQLSATEVTQALTGIELPDRALNCRLLGTGTDGIAATLDRLQIVMMENKLLPQAQVPRLLLDDRFVRTGAP